MKWQFEEYPNSLVETEVTQRDQFRNYEVDLAEKREMKTRFDAWEVAADAGFQSMIGRAV